MSKSYFIDLPSSVSKRFNEPIRDNISIIYLFTGLMNTINALGTSCLLQRDRLPDDYLVVSVDKMSRMIYKSKNKIYSTFFPFRLDFDDECLSIYHKRTSQLMTAKFISDLEEIINIYFSSGAEAFWDAVTLADQEIASLILELVLAEDGYLRYDLDEENSNGRLHPLVHFDIFYSSANTFKIGSNQKSLCIDYFVNLLDLRKDSFYFQDEKFSKSFISS